MINFCPGCNGIGHLGWPWWKRPCPVCRGETPTIHGIHLAPIPPGPSGRLSAAPPPIKPERETRNAW